MNYNISAYAVFLGLMVFIIVYVGRYFYTNGRVFIISLLNGQLLLADQVNRLLLVGYYLVNIGYAFLKLQQWQKISTMEEWLYSLTKNIGALILILAVLHYVNMLAIYYLSKSNHTNQKRYSHE